MTLWTIKKSLNRRLAGCSEDAAAFAEKVALLFNDDERRRLFGERAAELIRATCDFATVIPKLAAIIASR